jgi:uncharacterized protein YecE (DUF72 family)
MPGRPFLGTSGFAYAEWRGHFYPADIRSDAMLPYYAARFHSVEINYTFARHCSEAMLAKWIAQTPDGFTFSLKAHRSITQNKRLKPEAAEPLREFLTSIEPLGSKTGVILFQCPPNLKADLGLLREFLPLLPQGGRYAFEFRHGTWKDDAVYSLLQERGVAWCVADTDEDDAMLVRTTPSFTYLRLRKTNYEAEELARWAKQIAEIRAEGSDVYGYFKHEDEGRGVHFARALAEALSGS